MGGVVEEGEGEGDKGGGGVGGRSGRREKLHPLRDLGPAVAI